MYECTRNTTNHNLQHNLVIMQRIMKKSTMNEHTSKFTQRYLLEGVFLFEHANMSTYLSGL